MSNELQNVLLRAEMVTPDQLRLAGEAVLGTTSTWLEQLIMWRWVDEEAVARLASRTAGAPPCDLHRLAHLPDRVVSQLPRDLAVEHRVVPLSVEPDGDLCLGMVNPLDHVAVQEIEFFLGRRVLREVTPATPLAWALCSYYAASGPLWPLWDPETIVTRPARLARGSVPPPLVDRTRCA